jgi:hypothetical protein
MFNTLSSLKMGDPAFGGTVRGYIIYLKKYEERKATHREPRTVNPEPE